MKLCGATKWIPSIELEPANPKCSTKKYYHTSLLALNQSNLHDSRSRSSVSTNTVREESFSIIDILNCNTFASSLYKNKKYQEEFDISANNSLSISNEPSEPTEPSISISYDTNDSISPNINKNSTNTSKLHQFLFDPIDTDSDDDDIFPASLINMNYKAKPQSKTKSFVPCKMCLWEL